MCMRASLRRPAPRSFPPRIVFCRLYTMEATDSLVTRVQKHIDTFKVKNTKLAEENSRLKQQLADLKASNSRIRRIPKKPSDPAAAPAADASATA